MTCSRVDIVLAMSFPVRCFRCLDHVLSGVPTELMVAVCGGGVSCSRVCAEAGMVGEEGMDRLVRVTE